MAGSVPNIEEVGDLVPSPWIDSLRREVAQLLGARSERFPGAQPVSFSRVHLHDLTTRDYFVCEKSDGIRCLLYFTKNTDPQSGESEEVHYLIDRRNNYYQVRRLHFPRSTRDFEAFHVDTLLDGELVWDTEADGSRTLKYLVFDCMVMDGQNLTRRTLDKRLAFFHENVLTPYRELWRRFEDDCRAFAFRLEDKKTQRAYGIEMMFRDILPSLKHGGDGLIFTCRETPYAFGTDENILKWKPAEENTIDFKLDLRFPLRARGGHADGDGDVDLDSDAHPRRRTPSSRGGDEDAPVTNGGRGAPGPPTYDYDAMPRLVLHLYGGEREPDIEHAALYVTAAEWEKLKAWAVAADEGLDGQIVECHQDEQKRWRFNRIREDKEEANHYTIAEKVMGSIRDGVSQEDLQVAAKEMRSAWKDREKAAAGGG